MGASITATDLAVDDDCAVDWRETAQHGANVEALRRPDICDDDLFNRAVRFLPVDMNRIPANLVGFDFTWSSCALEHPGSIAAGVDFIEASIACLKPGGVAVHTTEFNLSSDVDTVDNTSTVLFRRQDFEALAVRLLRAGHEVMPFKYNIGDAPDDRHMDVAPYGNDVHLKLELARYVTTSFGLIVRRGSKPKRRWFGLR